MNRKIKFRVWDTTHKVMITDNNVQEVVRKYNEGYLSDYEDYDSDYDCDEWYPYCKMYVPFDICLNEDKVLLQYTGLKDKNGVEIYEGDMVMYDYEWTKPTEIGIVTWNNKNASFQIKGHIPSSSMTHLNWMKVIGNIYESEELLDKKWQDN